MNKANKKMFLYIGIFFLILLAFTLIRNNKPNNSSISTDTAAQNTSITLVQKAQDTALELTETAEESISLTETITASDSSEEPAVEISYVFRNKNLLNQHYKKHGIDMGFSSAEEYEKAADSVINNPNSLHKIEAEDGDDIYYLEATNEFVVVSTDGYIRTYFNPDRGIDYFNKQ